MCKAEHSERKKIVEKLKKKCRFVQLYFEGYFFGCCCQDCFLGARGTFSEGKVCGKMSKTCSFYRILSQNFEVGNLKTVSYVTYPAEISDKKFLEKMKNSSFSVFERNCLAGFERGKVFKKN